MYMKHIQTYNEERPLKVDHKPETKVHKPTQDYIFKWLKIHNSGQSNQHTFSSDHQSIPARYQKLWAKNMNDPISSTLLFQYSLVFLRINL